MRGGTFDEVAFFRSIQASGARALLIGRRALVVLGLPVLTADYDFWITADDVTRFNHAAMPFELMPTKSPDEVRQSGRYVLENDEHIDVLVVRTVTARTGEVLAFEDAWSRRQRIELAPGVEIDVPAIDDLIVTKRVTMRPKDVEDIRLLEVLKNGGEA